jgi:hypothetical protein
MEIIEVDFLDLKTRRRFVMSDGRSKFTATGSQKHSTGDQGEGEVSHERAKVMLAGKKNSPASD